MSQSQNETQNEIPIYESDFETMFNHVDDLDIAIDYLEGDLEDAGVTDRKILDKVKEISRYVEGLADAIAWVKSYLFGEFGEVSIEKANKNLADAIATLGEIIALLGDIADRIAEAYSKSLDVRISYRTAMYSAKILLAYLDDFYHLLNDP